MDEEMIHWGVLFVEEEKNVKDVVYSGDLFQFWSCGCY
jgi:hypothetical protein